GFETRGAALLRQHALIEAARISDLPPYDRVDDQALLIRSDDRLAFEGEANVAAVEIDDALNERQLEIEAWLICAGRVDHARVLAEAQHDRLVILADDEDRVQDDNQHQQDAADQHGHVARHWPAPGCWVVGALRRIMPSSGRYGTAPPRWSRMIKLPRWYTRSMVSR